VFGSEAALQRSSARTRGWEDGSERVEPALLGASFIEVAGLSLRLLRLVESSS
jgi:hypothetical protein